MPREQKSQLCTKYFQQWRACLRSCFNLFQVQVARPLANRGALNFTTRVLKLWSRFAKMAKISVDGVGASCLAGKLFEMKACLCKLKALYLYIYNGSVCFPNEFFLILRLTIIWQSYSHNLICRRKSTPRTTSSGRWTRSWCSPTSRGRRSSSWTLISTTRRSRSSLEKGRLFWFSSYQSLKTPI